MHIFNRIRLVDLLFCIWLLAVVFSYTAYAVTALTGRIFIYWEYGKVSLSGPLRYTVYIKDAVMLVLFVMLLARKRVRSAYLKTLPFAAYCLCITIPQNGSRSLLLIVAGIREFLPLMVCLMLNIEMRKSGREYLIKKREIEKVTAFSLVTECVFLLLQVARHHMWSRIGKAGYRLPGTMGNGGSLGYFAIGAVVFVYCLYSSGRLSRTKTLMLIALAGIIALASGSRNALGTVLVVTTFFGVDACLSLFKLSRKKLYMIILPLIALLGIPAVKVLSNYVGRGKLAVSAGGRFGLFMLLFQKPLLQVVFGSGLGDRTNAAVSLKAATSITDGTLTAIIAQFGVFGLFVFTFFLCRFIWRLLKKNAGNRNAVIALIISLLISIISINIFEQPILMIYYFLSCYVLNYDSSISSEKMLHEKNCIYKQLYHTRDHQGAGE